MYKDFGNVFEYEGVEGFLPPLFRKNYNL